MKRRKARAVRGDLRSPGKRTAKKRQTKERILRAALGVFCKKGLPAATTREISRKAGIAEGTLFNYFKTKEDLALYFFEKETEEIMRSYAADKRLQKAPLAEQLFAVVHRQLDYIAPYEPFIGAVFFRALQPSSKLHPLSLESQELRVRYLRFIRGILADAEERGEIPPVGDLGAYTFGLYYIGIVTFWLHDGSRNKQRTLALLDRSLQAVMSFLRKGDWKW
jgi:AcrR family transcriptional regulator